MDLIFGYFLVELKYGARDKVAFRLILIKIEDGMFKMCLDSRKQLPAGTIEKHCTEENPISLRQFINKTGVRKSSY